MLERNPFWQLLKSRALLYWREPEVVFWTYGFPLLLVIGLGIAFDTEAEPPVAFDVVENAASAELVEKLAPLERFQPSLHPKEEALARLSRNITVLVVERSQGELTYYLDPSNPEALPAKAQVDGALQSAFGRKDALASEEEHVSAPGSRYVDFLVPGLVGMNIMMGGIWGIGFVIVDMRVRNQMKRLLATPMRRATFLSATLASRLIFFLPEAGFLLVAAYFLFGTPIRGNLFSIFIVALAGVLAFAGLGLLVACRAKRLETLSGLVNAVMVPMWIGSGIFFSASRFPDFMQPFIQALPLTQLINALRALILEGAPLPSQIVPLAALAVWCGATFVLALKLFRWG